MDETAVMIFAWACYVAWLALFAWMAWHGRRRLLLVLGSVMLLAFATTYAFVESEAAAPDYNNSMDLALGITMFFAAAMLLVPLAVAAIVYPIGRFWTK